MDKLSGSGAILNTDFFKLLNVLTLKKCLTHLGTKLQLMLRGNDVHRLTCVINPIKINISQSIKCL